MTDKFAAIRAKLLATPAAMARSERVNREIESAQTCLEWSQLRVWFSLGSEARRLVIEARDLAELTAP